jgi:anti-sigma B factor antagonist
MPDSGFPVEVVRGVPVVTAPEEIDITNAAGLRSALFEAAEHGTLVVDMTRTQFCDTAGLHALVGAHKRATAAGSEVVLVTAGAAVLRILAITGLDQVIPHVTSVEQALDRTSATGEPGSAREDVVRARLSDELAGAAHQSIAPSRATSATDSPSPVTP